MTPPPSTSLPPPVQTAEFAGPLDLLLEEVRRQNVAIENIAMAPIVSRFLAYLESAAQRNLNLDIEWLHMASTLILWKSRALLPGEASQPDPIRDQLVQQLLVHHQEVAEDLARRRAQAEKEITRSAARETPEGAEEAGFLSVWDLIQQARDLARWVEHHREGRRRWRQAMGIEPDDTSVAEMMDYLRQQLASAARPLDAVPLLALQTTLSRRNCLFLGLLEMVRDQEVQVKQNEVFGEILVSVDL